MYGEGGAPGPVPLHNLRVTSHVLHQDVPLGSYQVRFFGITLVILRGPGKGRGGAPGTVPLQNQQVTSRKACLRNADRELAIRYNSINFGPFRPVSVQFGPFRAASGDSWGVGWGRGGVGERAFCKRQEYHYITPHFLVFPLRIPFVTKLSPIKFQKLELGSVTVTVIVTNSEKNQSR